MNIFKLLDEKNGVVQDKYAARVVELIRIKYSADDEQALTRQALLGRKLDEYAKYDEYCEECKAQAKSEYGLN